ncbi:MAG TPA: anti-sigma factor [Dehalococcoidia bacterium]|nr:anti-sigma factor [Dehalococcoidia bacterium]
MTGAVETSGAQPEPLACDAVDELAAAYVLDAVPETEAAQLAAHLGGCDRHHLLLAELQSTVNLLPFAVEEVEPPLALKQRILEAARMGPGPQQEVSGQPAALPATKVTDFAAERRRYWRSPGFLGLAAAVLIAIGLGAWSISLQRRLDNRTAALAHQQAELQQQQEALAALASGGRVFEISGGGLQGSVVVSRDGTTAYLLGTAANPPPGKAYEGWMIRDGKPVPAGLIQSGGAEAVRLDGSAQGAQQIAFTLEPARGSATPTPPILAAVTIQ